MRTPLVAGLLLGLGGAALAGAPQEKPDRGPIIPVETNLVTLSVTVTDRHGAYVRGLERSNFTVFDNGERTPIEVFSAEDSAATVGLIIDSSGSMRERREAVTTAAAAFAAVS